MLAEQAGVQHVLSEEATTQFLTPIQHIARRRTSPKDAVAIADAIGRRRGPQCAARRRARREAARPPVARAARLRRVRGLGGEDCLSPRRGGEDFGTITQLKRGTK